MMQFLNATGGIMRLSLIPFSLKDLPKKWMQSHLINSIVTWDEFVGVFLRKYFPNRKMVKVEIK